jgi:hypothetical protein
LCALDQADLDSAKCSQNIQKAFVLYHFLRASASPRAGRAIRRQRPLDAATQRRREFREKRMFSRGIAPLPPCRSPDAHLLSRVLSNPPRFCVNVARPVDELDQPGRSKSETC